ncbi:MAG: hypothetical protein HRT61_20500 [Ekhidna sp.]|nr:hypothetical protein [Ekhidna sp.]
MNLQKILTLVGCVALFYQTYAQATDRFYNISRRDGLASGSITAIIQDKKGLIWLGTKKGLNRYDGSKFVNFHTGNSELGSNDISTLSIDNEGKLWIGTFGGGLHLLDLETDKIRRINNVNIGDQIHESTIDQDSVLWILSNKGLVNLESDFSPIKQLNNMLKNRGASLSAIDSTIWIGTQDGDLIALDSNLEYKVFALSSDRRFYIHKIHSLTPNSLLLGTRQHGLNKFYTDTDSLEAIDIEATDIRDIITDREGVVWVGTDGNGIYRISESTTKYEHNSSRLNSLVSNAVQVCFEDRDRNLWFGTAWDGISFLDNRMGDIAFHYSDHKGIDQSGVLSIYKEENDLWFGTDGAGLSLDNYRQEKDFPANQLAKNTYIQFIKKFDNDFWIGTFQSGFYKINEEERYPILNMRNLDD